MNKSLKWVAAFALAIVLPSLIGSLLRLSGVYTVEGTSIIPPTPAEASIGNLEATTTTPQIQSLTVAEVRDYVATTARQDGVSVAKALWIIDHESSDCWREGYYDPAIAGHEPNGTTSYGCWQFNDANPDFNMAVATNFTSSTQLAMQWILDGKIDSWTTYHYCRKYFPMTCPF